MRILTVVEDYPNLAEKSVMAFVHSRNLHYQALDHEVEVVSFRATQAYSWDGIVVHPLKDVEARLEAFDVVVLHMPNLRNGLRFWWKHRNLRRFVLVIHGHELLPWTKIQPEPFAFQIGPWTRLRRNILLGYDWLKLQIWKQVLSRVKMKSFGVIFVSTWMQTEAEKALGLKFSNLGFPTAVIGNGNHRAFLPGSYALHDEQWADFVTVRSFDDPKYAIDVVVQLARRYPEKTFHVYGHGDFFEHHPPPPNLRVIPRKFKQEVLAEMVNHYACALLPTRLDSQGVLMCELASLGMPILVSDIPICREMVGDAENVGWISNSEPTLPSDLPGASRSTLLGERFSGTRLAQIEINFFSQLGE